MPANVAIVLWSYNHQANSGWTLSVAQRLKLLTTQLESASQWMTEVAGELTTRLPFKGIFLAPEYFFTYPSPTNERRPMLELDRLGLENSLLETSRKFPDILFVPGTVFYAKFLTRSTLFDKKFDPVTGQRTLDKTTTADRRGRAITQLGSYIQSIPERRIASGFDIRQRARDGYTAHDNRVPSLWDIRTSLRDPTKDPLIVKNAAYLLLGGRRIAKYDKQSDWGEALGLSPDTLAFVPGVFKQCPTINGYRFGTEICFDHANAMLARRNVTPLHFHLVVSDWAKTTIGHMAMTRGGYFAHASTNYTQSSSVWRRTPDGAVQNITEHPTYWKEQSGPPGSKLDGYIVPLPPPILPPPPNR